MAKTPLKSQTPATSAPDIDLEAVYRVTLNEAVTVGQRRVSGQNVRLKGRVLADKLANHATAVASYELVGQK